MLLHCIYIACYCVVCRVGYLSQNKTWTTSIKKEIHGPLVSLAGLYLLKINVGLAFRFIMAKVSIYLYSN